MRVIFVACVVSSVYDILGKVSIGLFQLQLVEYDYRLI